VVEGIPDEGKAGASRATANQGGDARFMAAVCLGLLREKGANNKKVIDALEKATRDPDKRLREEAEKALRELRKKD
jgi:hypothetical protein